MNSVRVVVASKTVDRVREYKGKQYAEQGAAIFNGGDFPLPFKVPVEVGNEYEPGEYTLDPRSFIRDDFGNLKLKNVRLLGLAGSSATKKA